MTGSGPNPGPEESTSPFYIISIISTKGIHCPDHKQKEGVHCTTQKKKNIHCTNFVTPSIQS